MYEDCDRIKGSGMVWACSTYWTDENVYGSILWEAVRKILLKCLCVGRRMTLKTILNK